MDFNTDLWLAKERSIQDSLSNILKKNIPNVANSTKEIELNPEPQCEW